jgi:colanic acid/amylovoran biosynthesis glycosyltransferase
MPSILLMTNNYPYPPGEQFLEDEIGYWAESGFEDIRILPVTGPGEPRPVPEQIEVSSPPARLPRPTIFVALCRALLSNILRAEIRYLGAEKKLSLKTAWLALKEVTQVKIAERRLSKYLAKKPTDIIYCYWNDASAYAACEQKRKGWSGKVVSRAHRADLYEEERAHNYMPLKRQYVDDFDAVFCLSPEAADYFHLRFGGTRRDIQVAPLGVPLGTTLASQSPSKTVHIVSLSFCAPVKRIDRILDAVERFAADVPDHSVAWTHIGDGPLYGRLKAEAESRARGWNNLSCRFLGALEHEQVKRFFEKNNVDLFINSSASEGMPVSIMEAMSFGVPVIAPDVGSVSGLVSDERGRLLTSEPGPEDITKAIRQCVLAPEAQREAMARSARQHIETHFNADKNYPAFVNAVLDFMR